MPTPLLRSGRPRRILMRARTSISACLLLWASLLSAPWSGRGDEPPAPARADSFSPPDDIRFRRVDLISEGVRLTGEVFRPKDHPEDEKLPAIILCHGWGGTASLLRPEAIAFAR